MISFKAILPLLFVFRAYAAETPHGQDEKKNMGPIAFMWPPDRDWEAAADNIGPCGTTKGVGNRTDFPLHRGVIALIAQNESWSLGVNIGYGEDPIFPSSFITLRQSNISEIDPGHACYPVPDAPDIVRDGTAATLQLIYTSTFDHPNNETFYACADIRFVDDAKFKAQIPCFNATSAPQAPSGFRTGNNGSQDAAPPNKTSGAESTMLGGRTGVFAECIVAALLAIGVGML